MNEKGNWVSQLITYWSISRTSIILVPLENTRNKWEPESLGLRDYRSKGRKAGSTGRQLMQAETGSESRAPNEYKIGD